MPLDAPNVLPGLESSLSPKYVVAVTFLAGLDLERSGKRLRRDAKTRERQIIS